MSILVGRKYSIWNVYVKQKFNQAVVTHDVGCNTVLGDTVSDVAIHKIIYGSNCSLRGNLSALFQEVILGCLL